MYTHPIAYAMIFPENPSLARVDRVVLDGILQCADTFSLHLPNWTEKFTDDSITFVRAYRYLLVLLLTFFFPSSFLRNFEFGIAFVRIEMLANLSEVIPACSRDASPAQFAESILEERNRYGAKLFKRGSIGIAV